MKKPKNEELNFLYMDEKYQDKPKKTATNKKNFNKTKSKKIGKNNLRSKKNKGADPMFVQTNDTFDFDNEIVIGVTKIPDPNKKAKSKNKAKKKKNNNVGEKSARLQNKNKSNKKSKNVGAGPVSAQTNKKNAKKPNKKSVKKVSRKARIIRGIIKWTILLSALVASFIYFMMSPLFDVVSIEVVNNEKIPSDTIVSLSEILLGENIYRTSSKKIQQNVKQNAYIESVQVNRKLPNKIVLTVKEREATYMLEYANSYAYINNQGYILEISEEKLDVPIIIGYETKKEDIKAGNRLNLEDLEKLQTVLKIMESSNSNGIDNYITKINIQNKQNYTLLLEEEKKTAYIGNATNLSTRLLYLKAIMEEEKGVEGEIFIDGDLNKTSVYFRKKE